MTKSKESEDFMALAREILRPTKPGEKMNYDQQLEQQPSAREAREQDEANAIAWREKQQLRDRLFEERSTAAACTMGILSVLVERNAITCTTETLERLKMFMKQYDDASNLLLKS
jgi:hypothetical protein